MIWWGFLHKNLPNCRRKKPGIGKQFWQVTVHCQSGLLNIFSLPGEYDRKLLTGLSIEARIPKLSLFQGCKIPQVALENREDSISLPLSSGFHKIVVSSLFSFLVFYLIFLNIFSQFYSDLASAR